MLLAIDTSSLVLSCALAEEDRLIAEWTVQRKLTHSEQLIPHMDEMIKEGTAEIRCHFCNDVYQLTQAEMQAVKTGRQA